MRGLISLCLLTGIVWGMCQDSGDFFNERERGWFWKEVCVEKEKEDKKEEKPPTKVVVPWHKLDEMSPDEVKELVEKAKSIAIMHPTYENVREYKKLLLWIAQKAKEYAKVDYLVSMTDPEIASWLADRPHTPYARKAHLKVKKQRIEEILKRYKDKAGLVVFKKEGCPYCERQKPIVKLFQERYGWEVKWVDVSEFPNTATKLQVRAVPDIFLVLNRDGKAMWQRIGTGLQTLGRLTEGVIWGLHILGEVSDEELF